ncbi:DUF805 domain-containing protein [Demequina litorisediminis]|uniref:DUF805 domain-containing protein n=1 Tax=Demequina litorisediminis TaxID=1849022 RepID=A0ABQ6IDJ5_9MICO|nr:DUF805 domain-containing protein [Demequina litorisediminis]GMA35779.1 hypothetical protein GCM10025876_19830 [Demequina litorisediminis]
MGFGEAIKKCLGSYATFEGRARRREFWWFYLFINLVQFVAMIVCYVLIFAALAPMFSQVDANGVLPDDAYQDVWWWLIAVAGVLAIGIGVALWIPFLAVSARRLHDMGQTGHWLWLNLASLGIVPIIMAFFDSQPHDNRWGPDPKASERVQAWAPQYPAAQGQAQAQGQPGQPVQQAQPMQQTQPGEQPPTPGAWG